MKCYGSWLTALKTTVSSMRQTSCYHPENHPNCSLTYPSSMNLNITIFPKSRPCVYVWTWSVIKVTWDCSVSDSGKPVHPTRYHYPTPRKALWFCTQSSAGDRAYLAQPACCSLTPTAAASAAMTWLTPPRSAPVLLYLHWQPAAATVIKHSTCYYLQCNKKL